jgi:hypothetical protein
MRWNATSTENGNISPQVVGTHFHFLPFFDLLLYNMMKSQIEWVASPLQDEEEWTSYPKSHTKEDSAINKKPCNFTQVVRSNLLVSVSWLSSAQPRRVVRLFGKK